jgi:hypothetical protein
MKNVSRVRAFKLEGSLKSKDGIVIPAEFVVDRINIPFSF